MNDLISMSVSGGHSAPHDGVAWRWILRTREIATQPGNFREVGGKSSLASAVIGFFPDEQIQYGCLDSRQRESGRGCRHHPVHHRHREDAARLTRAASERRALRRIEPSAQSLLQEGDSAL